ncbi:MAG: transposase, partial [Actinomycetia bacterium]|nr:transposase [Actinomycetes bacterium]
MAFGWVRRPAAVLANRRGLDAATVRRRYRGVIAALARHRGKLGTLTEAFDHFRKVTRSYWPGLFRCYGVADLPRTNNDLEQFFGSYRYHERRCSGRKAACPGTVVRGSVRLVAAAATRLRPIEVADLALSDVSRWRSLRGRLERRQAVRTRGRRFRRDPVAYLASLEDALIKQALPP